MRVASFAATLPALALLAFAKPTVRDMRVHESRHSMPSGYVRSAAPDPNTELKLRIALKSRDMDGLIDALYSVSTPGRDSYGKHLSKEEVNLSCAQCAASC